MSWQGDRYHPLNDECAALAGMCSDLEAEKADMHNVIVSLLAWIGSVEERAHLQKCPAFGGLGSYRSEGGGCDVAFPVCKCGLDALLVKAYEAVGATRTP
jgi:hypothetical protein